MEDISNYCHTFIRVIKLLPKMLLEIFTTDDFFYQAFWKP